MRFVDLQLILHCFQAKSFSLIQLFAPCLPPFYQERCIAHESLRN